MRRRPLVQPMIKIEIDLLIQYINIYKAAQHYLVVEDRGALEALGEAVAVVETMSLPVTFATQEQRSCVG